MGQSEEVQEIHGYVGAYVADIHGLSLTREVVGSESMAVGECILVKHEDSADPKIDIGEQWKAKVLEVRALDSEHVYLRVAWLNRPEDLDTGRKAYHGKNELIPTNQMDVIDAMAVNGRLDVQYWDDADDESVIVGEDTYFWRQTLDFANTKTFSVGALELTCSRIRADLYRNFATYAWTMRRRIRTS